MPRLLLRGDLLQLYLVSEPLSCTSISRAPVPGGTDGTPGLALGLTVLGDTTALGLPPGGTATPTSTGGLESLSTGSCFWLFFHLHTHKNEIITLILSGAHMIHITSHDTLHACIMHSTLPGRTHPPPQRCDGTHWRFAWGRSSSLGGQ